MHFGLKKLVKYMQQASEKHLTPRHNIEKLKETMCKEEL